MKRGEKAAVDPHDALSLIGLHTVEAFGRQRAFLQMQSWHLGYCRLGKVGLFVAMNSFSRLGYGSDYSIYISSTMHKSIHYISNVSQFLEY